ncbi:hypothetical protein Bbelb_349880 [Branchiostoma belcheri]|nr:hypothetical protein Bbelb_349880 [Branchiostoma belcheri]
MRLCRTTHRQPDVPRTIAEMVSAPSLGILQEQAGLLAVVAMLPHIPFENINIPPSDLTNQPREDPETYAASVQSVQIPVRSARGPTPTPRRRTAQAGQATTGTAPTANNENSTGTADPTTSTPTSTTTGDKDWGGLAVSMPDPRSFPVAPCEETTGV